VPRPFFGDGGAAAKGASQGEADAVADEDRDVKVGEGDVVFNGIGPGGVRGRDAVGQGEGRCRECHNRRPGGEAVFDSR